MEFIRHKWGKWNNQDQTKKKRNDEHAETSEMRGDSPAFPAPPAALSEVDKQTMPGVATQIRAIIPDATILFGIHAIGSEEYEYHLIEYHIMRYDGAALPMYMRLRSLMNMQNLLK